MDLDRVSKGDVPNEINVIIEIPATRTRSNTNSTRTPAPCSSTASCRPRCTIPATTAMCPHTLSKDGDPVDVLVLTPYPLISGSVIRCRPVGVLKMTDESGDDAKVLAVPIDKLCKTYRGVESFRDLPRRPAQPDLPLLRALQGPRRGQVGPGRRLVRGRRGQAGDHGQRPDVQGRPGKTELLIPNR
jgi:inorganic pyrophosphatase